MALTLDDLEKIKEHAIRPELARVHDRIDVLAQSLDRTTDELKNRPCAIHREELDEIKSQVGKLIVIKEGVSKTLIWIVGISGPVATAALMKLLHL